MAIETELTGLERVRRALELLELNAEVVTPGVPMPTVPLAAEAIGCEPEQIIKTVVFTTPEGATVVAIANGTSRIDRRALAVLVGVAKLKLADPAFVLERTGYPAGGVSPIGIRDDSAQIVIDRRVLEQEIVYGGAGTEDDLLRLGTADLVRVTCGRIAEIVS